jgi:carboxypeptidase Taq
MSTQIDSFGDFPAYTKLAERSRRVAFFSSVGSLLHWDQQTFQPPAAGAYRASQIAALETMSHELWTAGEVGDWLNACEQQDTTAASTQHKGNLREWRKSYDRATKLPTSLVEELARCSALAHDAWLEARKQSAFPIFAPHLKRLVELSREQARCWGGDDLYDALLESYEPGAKRADLQRLFDGIAPHASALAMAGESLPEPTPLPAGPYPIEAQQAFNREVAEAIGFDFSKGRIDTAAHPFCTTLGPADIRLTTRYDHADFTSSLLGILHEAGHGLYEQGLPDDYFGTPAGSAVSLGIHESQSRLWENQVGRSREFWEFWFPKALRHFPCLKESAADAVYRHVNRVRRSLIRVEADAVTYDLHIILRFRLESALMDGDLSVDDLPGAWNSEFEKLFGLPIPDDAHGCLQDIHWSGASFGYFPTYTLGNLNAAQLFQAAGAAIPKLGEKIAAGQYRDLGEWLRKNIHSHGSTLLPGELISAATGKPTQPDAHLAYLQRIISDQTG